MRLAVLADVHSNLPALEAVLADVDRVRPDGIWVAGDLTGYNPWPNEVLEILRDRKVRAIRGNHDRGALGGDTSWFNELAAAAVRWTRIHLTPASVGYLKDLEDRTRGTMPEGLVAMYHGSPRNDDEDVFPWTADESVVRVAGAPLFTFGASHPPLGFPFRSCPFGNPGPLWQPRDGDPKAAWGLLDLAARTFEVRRVPYDVEAVAAQIRKADLPHELADRLFAGV